MAMGNDVMATWAGRTRDPVTASQRQRHPGPVSQPTKAGSVIRPRMCSSPTATAGRPFIRPVCESSSHPRCGRLDRGGIARDCRPAGACETRATDPHQTLIDYCAEDRLSLILKARGVWLSVLSMSRQNRSSLTDEPRNRPVNLALSVNYLVSPVGLEPTTPRLKVSCSTT
jgi:hypothetical protein